LLQSGRLSVLPTNIRLGWKDIHFNLFRTFVNYGRKKCYNIGPWTVARKTT
jgi:hypothetical protein